MSQSTTNDYLSPLSTCSYVSLYIIYGGSTWLENSVEMKYTNFDNSGGSGDKMKLLRVEILSKSVADC